MSLSFPRWLEQRILTSGGRRIAYYTVAHTLYSLLAGGFEIALILRLTGSFERVVFFNLLYFIFLYAAFALGTVSMRSGRASRLFRWDLSIQVLGSLYVMAMFAHLGNSQILAAFFLFKGTAEGLFWSSRHSALIHCVTDDRRDHWALALQTVTIIMGVILPVLSGFAISYLVLPVPLPSGTSPLPAGYYPVYALTAILVLLALLASPRLTIPRQRVSLRSLARLVWAPQKLVWLGYLAASTVAGFTLATALGVLNFAVLKTEFNMGLFSSWIAVASAVFFFGVRRLVRRVPVPRIRMVLVGGSGDFLSRLVYTLFLTVPGLVGKSLLDSFIVPLKGLFGDNILRRRVELLMATRGVSAAEGLLFQETVYFLARMVGCALLIAVLGAFPFGPVPVARTLVVLLLLYPFVDVAFIRALDRGNRRLARSRRAN
jgi:MFS family permease